MLAPKKTATTEVTLQRLAAEMLRKHGGLVEPAVTALELKLRHDRNLLREGC
jgi:hypothetical protein